MSSIKKISFTIAVLVLVMLQGTLVLAQTGVTSTTGNSGSGATSVTGPDKSGIFTLQNPLKADINSIGDLIQAFIDIVTYLLIIFAVLMFIYVGFLYIKSAAEGNASKIKDLHTQLMWLVVGVAIVIGARVIVQVVINTISATGTINPSVIESANRAAERRQ